MALWRIDSGLPYGIDSGLPNGIDSGLPNGIDSGLPNGIDSGLPNGIDSSLPYVNEWLQSSRKAEPCLACITQFKRTSTCRTVYMWLNVQRNVKVSECKEGSA